MPSGSDGELSEVMTRTSSVRILIDDRSSIVREMILWDKVGITHRCNGSHYISPEKRVGQICGCPTGVAEKKDNARKGEGPQPNVSVTFKMEKDPTLGSFYFASGSWDFLESLTLLESALSRGENSFDLSLKVVDLQTPSGVVLKYVSPALEIY